MSAALPFTVCGTAVRGKRLGSELGFPTANLDYPPCCELPPNGVYIAQTELCGEKYVTILNQGRHPTVPEGRATIESHLLGYEGGDLYGQKLTITYLHYLRPEKRFATLNALKMQMAQDERDALAWVAALPPADTGANRAAEPQTNL